MEELFPNDLRKSHNQIQKLGGQIQNLGHQIQELGGQLQEARALIVSVEREKHQALANLSTVRQTLVRTEADRDAALVKVEELQTSLAEAAPVEAKSDHLRSTSSHSAPPSHPIPTPASLCAFDFHHPTPLSTSNSSPPTPGSLGNFPAKVLAPWNPTTNGFHSGDIAVTEGVFVTVIGARDYWRVFDPSTGETGIIPKNYLSYQAPVGAECPPDSSL